MNWTIHAMRDLNRADPLPELGPRVEPTPPPAPAPVSRGDGFLVHPDGTLSTEIEPPSAPPPAPTPAPAPVAAPIPADAPPWPFPQGAMWRHINGLFYRWRDGRAECRSKHEDKWRESGFTERAIFDRRDLFEPIASAPAPLKVGDKVRLLRPHMWNLHEHRKGEVAKLSDRVTSDTRHKHHFYTDAGWFFWTDGTVEGIDWERA